MWTALAQKYRTEEQVDSLIDALYELGAKQNPEEIDYILPLIEEEYNNLVEYSKLFSDSINSEECKYNERDNEKSKKLSFSEFIESNPTIANGTSLVKYLGWTFLIVGAILGWFLKKRKRLFIGKMILSSLFPLFLVYSCAVDMISSFYQAWALAMLIMCGIMLLIIVCFYLYGYGTIIFIYKRSEKRLLLSAKSELI